MINRSPGSRARSSSGRSRNTGRTARFSGGRSASRSPTGTYQSDFFNELEEVSIDDRVDILEGRRLDGRNKGVGRNNDQGYVDQQALRYQTSPAYMQKSLNENKGSIQNTFNKESSADLHMEYEDHKNKSKSSSIRQHSVNVRRRTTLDYLVNNSASANPQFLQSMIMDEMIHKSYDLDFHYYDTFSEISQKIRQRSIRDGMTVHDWLIQASTGALLPDVDNPKPFKMHDFAKFAAIRYYK